MYQRPLLWITGGFVLGEILGLQSGTAAWILGMLLIIAAGGMFLLFRNTGITVKLRKKSRSQILWGLLLFFVLVGYGRANQERDAWERSQEWPGYGQEWELFGRVKQLREGEKRTDLVLETEVPGDFLVCVDRKKTGNIQIQIGEHWCIRGTAEQFGGPRNPGQFDFRGYYRAQKLCGRIWADSLVKTQETHLWTDHLKEALRVLTVRAGNVLDTIAEPEAAGILRAVILGDRTRLDPEIKALYQRNGIAHVLAISALHLSLISMAVYRGLRMTGLGYGGAGFTGGFFLIAYAVMSGGSPSVVRASVMTLLGYLAAFLGRTYDLLTALSAAALLILWESPYQLTQSGVQLSFGAVLGIAVVAPALKKKGFSPGMAVSLGLQLNTIPLILYHEYQLPIYSIFLNLIVVPLMGIVIASGMSGILLGFRWTLGGRFAIAGSQAVLVIYEYLCRIASRIPGSVIVTGQPAVWKIAGYYGLLVLYFSGICAARKNKTKKVHGMNYLLWAGMLLLLIPMPQKGLRVTFLDVGQGDGICIQRGFHTILVDGGSSSEKKIGENVLEPFLKCKGIHIVDYAVVSHGDADHMNGLESLLTEGQDIWIRNMVLPGAGRGDEIYDRLAAEAKQRGTTVLWMEQGDRLDVGGITVTCLFPQGAGAGVDGRVIPISSERNDHSLVLQTDYGEFHMLLTGDMTETGERTMLQAGWVPAGIQVIKLAHHGSSSSSCQDWLEAIAPTWAILSYGNGNRYGHPHAEVTDRLKYLGIKDFRTGESGAVWLDTDGESIRFETFLH